MRWASIATLLYAVILVTLMFTINFSLSAEEPLDEGILIEFGDSDMGQGEEELAATDVATIPEPEAPLVSEEVVETDDRNDVEIERPLEESKPQPQPTEEVTTKSDSIAKEVRTVNQKALFPGRKEESTATSQGSSEGVGNAGSQSGNEGGESNIEGGGSGLTGYVDLKDRSIVGSLPKPENIPDNTSGRVVIDVVVDDRGEVTHATYRAQGSTTNNSKLVDAARTAALKARFTTSDEFTQAGTITYIFNLN